MDYKTTPWKRQGRKKNLGGGNFPSWPLPEATSLSEGSRESLDCNEDGNYDDDDDEDGNYGGDDDHENRGSRPI